MRGSTLEPEFTALVATASATLISLMTTDAWKQAKVRFQKFWALVHPGEVEPAVTALEAAQQSVLAADPAKAADTTRALEIEWAIRLSQLPASPGVIAELKELIKTLRVISAETAGATSVAINITGSPSGTTNIVGQGTQINLGR